MFKQYNIKYKINLSGALFRSQNELCSNIAWIQQLIEPFIACILTRFAIHWKLGLLTLIIAELTVQFTLWFFDPFLF